MPHFLILHDSNKLEDYSLDPVTSPSIDYGSWSDITIPHTDRAFGYVIIEPDMALGKAS